jgi:hypothetical protein
MKLSAPRPPAISTRPPGSGAATAAWRAVVRPRGSAVNVLESGSNTSALAHGGTGSPCPPATRTRPSASGAATASMRGTVIGPGSGANVPVDASNTSALRSGGPSPASLAISTRPSGNGAAAGGAARRRRAGSPPAARCSGVSVRELGHQAVACYFGGLTACRIRRSVSRSSRPTSLKAAGGVPKISLARRARFLPLRVGSTSRVRRSVGCALRRTRP